MSDQQPQVKVLRSFLFRKAESVNQGMLKRLGEAARHLSENRELAVIGALSGMEFEIESIRTMMVLMRDYFPAENERKLNDR